MCARHVSITLGEEVMIQIPDIKEVCRNERDVEVPALLSFVENVIASDPQGIQTMIDVDPLLSCYICKWTTKYSGC